MTYAMYVCMYVYVYVYVYIYNQSYTYLSAFTRGDIQGRSRSRRPVGAAHMRGLGLELSG